MWAASQVHVVWEDNRVIEQRRLDTHEENHNETDTK